MGINKLLQSIKKYAPKSLKSASVKDFAGKTLAVDASIPMYEFLTQTHRLKGNQIYELLDSEGNPTAHLMGLLNRTVFFLKNNIQPLWVFDGVAPPEKYSELEKRRSFKEISHSKMEKAISEGDMERALLMKVQTVKVSPKMQVDAKKLIKLLGLPFVEAPGEAEAQCAYLSKKEKVDACCSNDSDCLAFGASNTIIGLKATSEECLLLHLQTILKELEVEYDHFVDFCILCGTDYNQSIKGIGPNRALGLIKQYKSIEKIREAGVFSEEDCNVLNYQQIREALKKPLVLEHCDLEKTRALDKEELFRFLVEEKKFSKERLEKALQKIEKHLA